MHRRTLNRRLRAQGTTLHRLVEETRFEIARQLVENTRIPLTEVAAILAYADASAFTRAFRRWTGTAPNRWRSAPPGVAEWQAIPRAAAYAPRPRSRQRSKRRST
jgi:AraC-like DNA-binding protein